MLNYLFLQLFQRVVNVETCSKAKRLILGAKVDGQKHQVWTMTKRRPRDREFGLLWPIQEIRFASFHIVFHSWNTFLCKIQTIRHPLQDQDLTAIQVPKLLAVLAVHLQLQGLAAHLYPPLAHRRQAGGHELPAVCQTNGETKFGGAYWHKTKQIRCGKIEEVELNLNCRTRK